MALLPERYSAADREVARKSTGEAVRRETLEEHSQDCDKAEGRIPV